MDTVLQVAHAGNSTIPRSGAKRRRRRRRARPKLIAEQKKYPGPARTPRWRLSGRDYVNWVAEQGLKFARHAYQAEQRPFGYGLCDGLLAKGDVDPSSSRPLALM